MITLTGRHGRAAALLYSGYQRPEIARMMGTSERNVKAYINHACRKALIEKQFHPQVRLMWLIFKGEVAINHGRLY